MSPVQTSPLLHPTGHVQRMATCMAIGALAVWAPMMAADPAPATAPATTPVAAATPALAVADPTTIPKIGLVPAFAGTKFDHPLWMLEIPGSPGHFLVLEQPGMAKVVDATGAVTTFMDLTEVVNLPRGYTEEGLLALAFHPDYHNNRTFFTWYTTKRTGHLQTVLARWQTRKESEAVDPASEKILLTTDKPWGNHNGGDLQFGADGYLYLSMGDGGAGGDPGNRAQNLGVLLGKILRIDVDHTEGDLPYAIPKDNPFVGKTGARGEVWAYGLRNVWRMAFDPTNGDLWAADVGQDKWEEVDLITKGGNYGWRAREGTHPFKPEEAKPDMIEPIWDYGHDQGRSITGGFVYRGKAIPELRGTYLCADWLSRRVWGLRRSPTAGARAQSEEIATVPGMPSSFGIDTQCELYITAFDGRIYQVVAEGTKP